MPGARPRKARSEIRQTPVRVNAGLTERRAIPLSDQDWHEPVLANPRAGLPPIGRLGESCPPVGEGLPKRRRNFARRAAPAGPLPAGPCQSWFNREAGRLSAKLGSTRARICRIPGRASLGQALRKPPDGQGLPRCRQSFAWRAGLAHANADLTGRGALAVPALFSKARGRPCIADGRVPVSVLARALPASAYRPLVKNPSLSPTCRPPEKLRISKS